MTTDEEFPCELHDAEREQRVGEWSDVAAHIVGRDRLANGFRISFDLDAHARLQVLVSAEERCCGWATWTLVREETASVLDVTGPAPQITALAEAFGL